MAVMSDLTTTRRTCILVDLENYSDLDGQQKHAAQAALAGALTSAADSVGLDRLSWERQVSGDGELAVLPDGQSQVDVVGAFPIALDAALRAVQNRTGLLLRVRMAVVYGVATPAELGYSDQAVVDAARIANAQEVREAFARADDGYLVLAVSAELFRDVIRSGRSAIRSDRFLRVRAERSTVDAWITVPGVDPSRLRNEPKASAEGTRTTPIIDDSRTAAAAGRDLKVTGSIGTGSTAYPTTFKGSVSTNDLHIGPRHG